MIFIDLGSQNLCFLQNSFVLLSKEYAMAGVPVPMLHSLPSFMGCFI